MKTAPISLQVRLIKSAMFSSIVAGSIALIFLLLLSVYQTMNVQDEIMDEISDMLLSPDINLNQGKQVDELSQEFEIIYQLKLGTALLSQSQNFPMQPIKAIPLLQEGAYAYVWYDQQLWRSYTTEDTERQLQVQLYQPLSERFGDFWASISFYAAGLLLLWLLQVVLLHFSIKKHFYSIKQLSQHIAAKDSNDLTPIQQIQPEFVELQPMIQQVNLLLARLQHTLTAEQRFTADAAHELRSPLSAMQMRLQVLKRKHAEQLTAVPSDLLAIQQDLDRGVQVLENLLLLARLDPTDQQQLSKQTFDLQQLLVEVVQSLTPFIKEKNIRLDIQQLNQQASVDTAVMLHAQREFLYICLRNLIDNAIRYSEVGAEVLIQYDSSSTQCKLWIIDHGQQLTAETLQRMGERFYRALGSKTQGSGLGLSICKKIIELHQGQMTFQQTAQGGLSVCITLATM